MHHAAYQVEQYEVAAEPNSTSDSHLVAHIVDYIPYTGLQHTHY